MRRKLWPSDKSETFLNMDLIGAFGPLSRLEYVFPAKG